MPPRRRGLRHRRQLTRPQCMSSGIGQHAEKKVPGPSALASINFSAVDEPGRTLYTYGELALPTIRTPPGAMVKLSGCDFASAIKMSVANAACAKLTIRAAHNTRRRACEIDICRIPLRSSIHSQCAAGPVYGMISRADSLQIAVKAPKIRRKFLVRVFNKRMRSIRPEVRGVGLDYETRCVHYHSPFDVVAIKMACCGIYYACKDCHETLANHAIHVWPGSQWDERAVLCGVCGHELTIREYMNSSNACTGCGAGFNPGCRNHYHYYFESEIAR